MIGSMKIEHGECGHQCDNGSGASPHGGSFLDANYRGRPQFLLLRDIITDFMAIFKVDNSRACSRRSRHRREKVPSQPRRLNIAKRTN